MLKITSSELRKRMGEALVAVQSDTIQILRHGRPMAFLLSVDVVARTQVVLVIGCSTSDLDT